jgi:hypothetical protein
MPVPGKRHRDRSPRSHPWSRSLDSRSMGRNTKSVGCLAVALLFVSSCAFSIYNSISLGLLLLQKQQDVPVLLFLPTDPATLSNLSQSRNEKTATTTTTKTTSETEPTIMSRHVLDNGGVDSAGEIQSNDSNNNRTSRAPQVFGLTYGTVEYEKTLNRLKQEADASGLFQSFEICRTKDLDAGFVDRFRDVLERKRGGGYWIWKVPLIQQHLKRLKYGDILVYLDGGDSVNKNGADRFWWYVEQMQRTNTSILTFQMGHHKELKWTSDAIFKYFNITPKTSLWDKVANTGQYIASMLIMRKTPQLESIMAMYNQTLYDDPYLFTDSYNKATKAKRGNFGDNRHDQSVFSVIRKLFPNDTFVLPDETFKPKTAVPFITSRVRGFDPRKMRLERNRLEGLQSNSTTT